MEPFELVTKRLTDLELLFMHLERRVADLHAVVLRQEQQSAATEKQLRALARDVQGSPAVDEPDEPE